VQLATALAKKEKRLMDAEAAFNASSCKGFRNKNAAQTAAEKAACAPLKAKLDEAQKARDECAAGSCESAKGAAAKSKPTTTTTAPLRPLPTIVAHRGASHDAPENTLASFVLAWEQGADAIEADFYLTSDGHVVCTHDSTTGKFNSPAVAINDTPLAQLKTLDFGAWKHADFAGERIPTIAEVFATVPSGKQIYIELKEGRHIVAPVKAAIDASGLAPEQIVIMSFKTETVSESKLLMPHIKALWLYGWGGQSSSVETIADTLASTQADGVAINHNKVTATLASSLMQPRIGGYPPPPPPHTHTHTPHPHSTLPLHTRAHARWLHFHRAAVGFACICLFHAHVTGTSLPLLPPRRQRSARSQPSCCLPCSSCGSDVFQGTH